MGSKGAIGAEGAEGFEGAEEDEILFDSEVGFKNED